MKSHPPNIKALQRMRYSAPPGDLGRRLKLLRYDRAAQSKA